MEDITTNKILVDEGVVVDFMPSFLLRKIGKYDTDLRAHNMVLSNYEGKIGKIMGVIQVDVTVGSITRPTIFLVITLKVRYNMLLGREWIHGMGVVPFSLYQRIMIWRNDGIMENMEADQGYYTAEVNHVDKRNFYKNLANIAPCIPVGFVHMPLEEEFYSLKLHPTHGFMWDVQIMSVRSYDTIRPT